MKLKAADGFHPASAFVYIAALLILAMMFFDPVFIALNLIIAVVEGVIFTSLRSTLKGLLWGLPAIAVVAAVNGMVSRGGQTVLFYFLGTPITLESVFYGVCSGVMLVSIILYFTVYNRLLPPEKFLYLFSGILPAFSMVVIMTQRFFPAIIKRFGEIRAARRNFKKTESGKKAKKLQPLFKEISALLSWSMEEGLETADSMKAKGYGCAKRSSYAVYKFTAKDTVLICLTLVLTASAIVFYYCGAKTEFYPEIEYSFGFHKYLSLAAVLMLGALLPMGEALNSLRWRIRKT